MVSLRPEPDSRRPATVAELMRRHFISLAPKDSFRSLVRIAKADSLNANP